MVFALIFTNFQSLSYVFAHDNISSGYSFEQTYDEESNTVVIKGNGSNVPNNIQITSIKADDGSELNLENPEYTAKENKDYSFLISYLVFTQDGENVSSDTREETKTVSVSEIKDKSEEKSSEENTTEEVVNENTEKTEELEEHENQVITMAGKNLMLTADSPKEKNSYNLSISININDVKNSNYQVKLTFPQYVKIADSFEPGKIESISNISNEVVGDKNVSTITLNNEVMTGNNTHIEVHIPIDQTDFLSAVRSTEYQISASYLVDQIENDNVNLVVDSGTYRNVSDVEYVATDTLFIGEWQVEKIKVMLDSRLDKTKLEDTSSFSINKDSNLEYDISGTSFAEESDKYITTVNKDQIKGESGSYYVELPIKIKIKESYLNEKYKNFRNAILTSEIGSHTLSYAFNTQISYLNTQEESVNSNVKYAGILLEASTSNIVYYNNQKSFDFDYDKLQPNSSINLFTDNLFSVNVIESWSKGSQYYEFSNSKNVSTLSEKLKVNIELTLPENVTWKGDDQYYDSSSRKVVIPVTDYEVNTSNNSAYLVFGKFTNMNMIISKLEIDGSNDGQIAATIPYKLSGTYKEVELSGVNSNIVIKSNKLGANLDSLSSVPDNVEKNTENQNVVLNGKFDSFKMSYNEPVKLNFEIDDKFADLKEVKLHSNYNVVMDRQFGQNWSVEYKEVIGDQESVKSISRDQFIAKGISSESGRIVSWTIISDKFMLNDSVYNTNMFELKLNVLANNRYTNAEIVEGDVIVVSSNSDFGGIKKDLAKVNIRIIEDKSRASVKAVRLFGSNGNEKDTFVENTTNVFGYYLSLSNYNNIVDEDGLIEDQSVTLNFTNFDKIRVKKFALSKGHETDVKQVIEVQYSSNLREYTSTITFEAGVKIAEFSDQILKVDDPENEYIKSITITSDIKKSIQFTPWYFLNRISFEADILDTDFVNQNNLPQNMEFFSLKEEKTDFINVSKSTQNIKVIPQKLEYYYRSGLSKSSLETNLSETQITRGDSFKVSQNIDIYSQWTYGDFSKQLWVYHDTYNNYGMDESKILDPYFNNNGYQQMRTLDKKFLEYSIVNPIIYIPLTKGFDYVDGSFKIKNSNYSSKTPEITIVNDENDQKYLKIRFYGDIDDNTSLYVNDFDTKDTSTYVYYDEEWLKSLDIEYELSTSIITPFGNSSISSPSNKTYVDVITGFESYAKKIMGQDSSVSKYFPSTISEEKTFDGNTATYLISNPTSEKNILVSGESIVSLDTLLEKDNSYRTELSVLGGEDYSLISAISNGTKSDIVSDAYIYIPIKKNSSNNYQFNFEMTGPAEVSGTSSVDTNVSYSTSDNPSMNYDSNEPEYSKTVSNWEDVTCVKIRVQNLKPSTQVVVNVPVTNETKTDIGNKINRVKSYYKYFKSSDTVQDKTNERLVTLKDTEITGKVWDDSNMNGVYDSNELGLEDISITYSASSSGESKIVNTNSNGIYTITLPEMDKGASLKITVPEGKNLVPEFYDNVSDSKLSHFSRDNKTVELSLGKTSNINAGLYTLQPITTDSDVYDIYIGRKPTNIGAKYAPDTPKQILKYSLEEKYNNFLTVDSEGNMEGHISVSKVPVEVYYVNSFGDRISKEIEVNVKFDNPPVLTVPEVLEFNIGDKFDPKDPDIIKGLSVSDEEDNLTIEDLQIEESVPREGKFLWLFTTDDTNRLNKEGTYEVTYTVKDSASNTVTKKLKVKVNGLPYFTNTDNVKYDDQASQIYLRAKSTGLDPYHDLKAFYLKASDVVGEEAKVTEIPNSYNVGSQSNGELSAYHFANVANPDEMVDNINDAGKYIMKYRATTPTNASAEINRDVYVRGNVENISAHSIVISESDTTKYTTWDQFLEKYGKEIEMSATVDVPQETGDYTTVKIDQSNIDINTDINTIPFGSLKTGESYAVHFTVTDSVDNYSDSKGTGTFYINVQDKVGLTPHIQLPAEYDNQRVVGDLVYVNNNLRENNFLQALLDEVTIYDVDASGNKYEGTPESHNTNNNQSGEKYGIVEKKVQSIYRIDKEEDQKIYEDGDSISQSDLDEAIRNMYDTVGQYKVLYTALDGDGNRINKERIIHVASKNKFVAKVGDEPGVNDVEITDVNLRQAQGTETATGVVVYHFDSNGTLHQQAALSTSDVDLSQVGQQNVTFTSLHHYSILPGTNGKKRDHDSVVKTYLIHGNITFSGLNDKTVFSDSTVNLLEGIEATFDKAIKDGKTTKEKADISINYEGNMLSVTSPQKINVEYTATDNVTGVELGKTIKGTRNITFIGLPEIHSQSEVVVKQGASEAEIKKAINATSSINLVDQTIALTPTLKYDYSLLEKDGKVVLSQTYTIDGTSDSRTVTKDVKVVFAEGPTLTSESTKDLSVGDTFDPKNDTNLQLVLGYDKDLTLDNVSIYHRIPISDNKLTEPGQYKINYFIKDKYGNTSTCTTILNVQGLPVISEGDVNTRVNSGIDLEKQFTAKYQGINDKGNVIDVETPVTLVSIKKDGQVVDSSLINKEPGLYTMVLRASNGNGKSVEVERLLFVHGEIVFTGLDESAYFIKTDVNALKGVNATFKKVNADGTIVDEKAEITTNVEGDKVTSNEPARVQVTYTAKDTVTGVEFGNTKEGTKSFKFIGEPYIESVDSIDVKEAESQDAIIDMAKKESSAFINLVDETKDITNDISYELSEDYSQINLKVTYTLNGETREATHVIAVNFKMAPTILGKEKLEMNVGDAFDLIKTPEIVVTPGDSELTIDDVKIDSKLPMSDGKLTTAGTFTITYSLEDKYGNTATFTTKVLVDSIPEITTEEVHSREGYDYDLLKNASATYLQAQETGDPILTKSDVKITSIESVTNKKKSTDLPTSVGKYVVTYSAENSNSKEKSIQNDLYIHGKIEIKNINEQKLFINTDFDVLDGVTATFKKVEKDGTIVDQNADISTNLNDNVLNSSEPKVVKVEYTAKDNVTGVKDGDTVTADRNITFIGNPEISAPALLHVSLDETDEEIINRVKEQSSAQIDTVEKIEDISNSIEYKLSDNRDVLHLSVKYSIGEVSRVAKHDVEINYIPEIFAKDMSITVGDEFNDDSALNRIIAIDTEDGNISESLKVVKNDVDTSKPGVYEVTYEVTDSKGATANKTIYVTVNPKSEIINNIPTITATDKVFTVGDDVSTEVLLKDVYAYDKEDGNLSDHVQVLESNVDNTKPGNYQVTYVVSDSLNAKVTKTITVVVNPKSEIINSIPVIQASDKFFAVGDKVDDKTLLDEVTAFDSEDGDISKNVKVLETNVDTTKEGTYYVVYTVKDSLGASSTLKVNVVVSPRQSVINQAPIILAADKAFNVGDEFNNEVALKEVYAKDAEDGDITYRLFIQSHNVDTSKAGNYYIIYGVTDSSGITTTKKVNVVVHEKGTDGESNGTGDSPQTGDSTNIYLWLSTFATSAILFILLGYKKKRKED